MNKWIDVNDRLPEEDGEYMVTVKYGYDSIGIDILTFSNDLYKLDSYDFTEYKNKHKKGFCRYDSEVGYYETDNVIAWMPLPEPYKNE